MKIKWFGHSCFLLTSSNGARVLTDPFDESVGYKVPKMQADIVTTSHKHYDHYNLEALEGEYVHLDSPGHFVVKDIDITGIGTYHDKEYGRKRGSNVVFVFDMDGLKVCHLGDLGYILPDEQIKEIGQADILLLPVGGTYTIDFQEAAELVSLMNPKVVIPMHYKTPATNFSIDGVENFLGNIGSVDYAGKQEIEINPDFFTPTAKVILLNYE
jgi:L-ascorbate metabolism protein UlaG (beta-lactamase superfamily)